MTFVEGIGGKLLPVAPYLLQHLGVMTVLHSSLYELGLHGIHDILFLLTHGFAQSIALAAGEVGQQSAQQHDLFLIDCDAIGVLQILLHDGDVILDFFAPVLACDEGGDIVHGPWSVEGIHGYEVLEDGGVEFLEIFLHACRLKLEGAYGASILIQLIGLLVIDGQAVQVDVHSVGFLDHAAGLLHL